MNGIEETRPKNWLELQRFVFDDPWPSHAGKFHSNLIHRGMGNADWKMASSLERRGLVSREKDLIRNFQKYARDVGVDSRKEWEWLTIGQHHGLPTRLLDWTYSPLVALHFATSDWQSSHDAVVWSLDYVRVLDRLPKAVRKALKDDAAAFTTQMLDEANLHPTDLPPKSGSDEAYMIVLEPPSLDERVVNQYAGLSAMSRPGVDIEDWLRSFKEPVAQKLVIPANLKAEVREKLDKSNINERVIYPGLDGLSTWLARYYATPERKWIK